MILIFPIFLAFSDFSLDFLQPVSKILHSWCLLRVDTYFTDHKEIYQAIVCGKKLSNIALKEVFSDTGLIHLMVVSGAHLLFLEKAWNYLPQWNYKQLCIALSLVLYVLMAQVHPPIFRALMSYFLFHFSQYFRLFWSPRWRIMISGIVCLILNPQWINSMSLQMSWLGALAFTFVSHSKILTHCLCYLILLPIISQWITLNPLTILINWILFPLISTILFPLTIISFLIPSLEFLSSSLWYILTHLLSTLQPYLHQTSFFVDPINKNLIWIYIGVLFLIAEILWILNRKLTYNELKERFH